MNQSNSSQTVISMDKKYNCRNGCEFFLATTNGPESGRPVIGCYRFSPTGAWVISAWPADGISTVDPGFDLIEVREPRQWALSIHHDKAAPTLYRDGDEFQGWCKEVVDVQEIMGPSFVDNQKDL